MKKKPAKKIVLSKETLRHLEDRQAEEVQGGASATCTTTMCTRSCYNSCPPSCDC
jgi:hypothetical protein